VIARTDAGDAQSGDCIFQVRASTVAKRRCLGTEIPGGRGDFYFYGVLDALKQKSINDSIHSEIETTAEISLCLNYLSN